MVEWQTYLDAESFDLGQPDASFTSGLHQVVQIARSLEAQGCDVAPHAWGAGGSLMQNIHVGFACRNTRILELPPDPGPLHTEVYSDTLRMEDGRDTRFWACPARRDRLSGHPVLLSAIHHGVETAGS